MTGPAPTSFCPEEETPSHGRHVNACPTHLTVLVPLVLMKPLLRLMDLDRIMGVLVS